MGQPNEETIQLVDLYLHELKLKGPIYVPGTPMLVTFDYDYNMDEHRNRVSQAMGVPTRMLTGDIPLALSFEPDSERRISDTLAEWTAMIRAEQRKMRAETDWIVERFNKWPKANWRRLKRERRKFMARYDDTNS